MIRNSLVAVCLLAAPVVSQASIILQSNFDGRTVSGTTASSITWAVDGIAEPGDLEFSSNDSDALSTFGLFDTPAAVDRIAVQRNLHNEGDWFTSIALDVGPNVIDLGPLTLDAYIFDRHGTLQTFRRDFDLKAEIFDESNVGVASLSVVAFGGNSGSISSQPNAVTFDFTGVATLAKNTGYTLRLTGTGEGPGNNSGFDNLKLTGKIPAPAPLLLFGIGLLALGARRLSGNRKILKTLTLD